MKEINDESLQLFYHKEKRKSTGFAKNRKKIRCIARGLGRSLSTISRKIRRNAESRESYSPCETESPYCTRRKIACASKFCHAQCMRNLWQDCSICIGRLNRSATVWNTRKIPYRSAPAPSTESLKTGFLRWNCEKLLLSKEKTLQRAPKEQMRTFGHRIYDSWSSEKSQRAYFDRAMGRRHGAKWKVERLHLHSCQASEPLCGKVQDSRLDSEFLCQGDNDFLLEVSKGKS